MAGVDVVEDRLSDEVIRDGEEFEIMPVEQLPLAGAVSVVGEGLVDLEVIPPAGEFETVITEVAGLFAQVFEFEIGPLAGEQSDGTSHRCCLSSQRGACGRESLGRTAI